MMNDEQLMLKFQQGKREAFVELFERYRQPIYGFFRRRLSDAGRAEELAQETFLAVLQGAARYEPRALFRTYLYAIALNLLRAERRNLARAPQVRHGANDQQQNPGNTPAGSGDLDEVIYLRSAIQQLDDHQREVLLLREYEQLSYGEIAQVLQVPVNTVRSQLFRARMALRELLAPQQRG
jgi:RNA polymerase sigma-70 factor (ECF subfamily)